MEVWLSNPTPHICNRDTPSGYCRCDFYIIDDLTYKIGDPEKLVNLIPDFLKDKYNENRVS